MTASDRQRGRASVVLPPAPRRLLGGRRTVAGMTLVAVVALVTVMAVVALMAFMTLLVAVETVERLLRLIPPSRAGAGRGSAAEWCSRDRKRARRRRGRAGRAEKLVFSLTA